MKTKYNKILFISTLAIVMSTMVTTFGLDKTSDADDQSVMWRGERAKMNKNRYSRDEAMNYNSDDMSDDDPAVYRVARSRYYDGYYPRTYRYYRTYSPSYSYGYPRYSYYGGGYRSYGYPYYGGYRGYYNRGYYPYYGYGYGRGYYGGYGGYYGGLGLGVGIGGVGVGLYL